MKFKKIAFTLFIFLIIFHSFSCRKRRYRTKKIEKTAVKVLKVKKQNIKDRIYLNGDVKGIDEIYLYSFSTGVLKRKFVNDGQRVYKGQALFAIDQTIRGLDLRDYIVISPLTGIISDIQIDVGAQVIANQTVIAKVVKNNVLKVETYITESDANKVKVGNGASIKVEAVPNKTYEGKVSRISPIVNLNNRTIKVEIIIQNHDNKIKSGMFAEVQIITNIIKNKIALPLETVIFDDSTTYVYVLNKKDKKAVKRKVKVGDNFSRTIIIENGLKSGDLVIIEGHYSVLDGFPVKVKQTSTQN